MGHFDRNNRGGGNFGKRKFAGRNSGRSQMHDAVCDSCNRDCQVPFRPTGNKPIFCSNCFEKQGGGGRSNNFRGRDGGRDSFGQKEMHDAVCDKCNEKCQVPFRPSGDKPIFCSDCFEKQGNSRGGRGGISPEQFEMLNNKLDKIMKALSIKPEKKVAIKNKVAKDNLEAMFADDPKEEKEVKKEKKTAKKKTTAKKTTKKETKVKAKSKTKAKPAAKKKAAPKKAAKKKAVKKKK